MGMTVVPIIVSALGIVAKMLEKKDGKNRKSEEES